MHIINKLTMIVGLSSCFAIAFSRSQLSIAENPIEISGIVLDEEGSPVSYANVYVRGGVEGASTTEDGLFSFFIIRKDSVTIEISSVGYQACAISGVADQMNDLHIVLKGEVSALDELVVFAGNYHLKSPSSIHKTSVVDILSTAGSGGDLYKAVALLPGTQAPERDGRLLVRGGTSRETQTYIDDMHVLSPYTPSFGEVGARGRYSPTLFEGVSFSLGGYVPEYSQGLSAVLPLYSADEVSSSKIGVDVMNVSLGSNGVIPWHKGSTSYNVVYTDLTLYSSLFIPHLKSKWKDPYRQIAAQNQLRFTLGENTFLKSYFAYSKAGFTLMTAEPFSLLKREMNLSDDNLYLNTTFRKRWDGGASFFSGIAYSFNRSDIGNAAKVDDLYATKEQEMHLKSKAEKRFSDYYKMSGGVEMFLKRYNFMYADSDLFETRFDHSIGGAFISNDIALSGSMSLNVSARMEHASLSDSWAFLPRVALGYKWRDLSFSGIIGRYQQNVDNEVLIYQRDLLPEKNTQVLFGVYYAKNSHIFRIEAYHKQYKNLPLESEPASLRYTSAGNGYSRGIDLFLNDTQFLKYWEYMISYSYNDSRRHYLDYPYSDHLSFAMRHNAAATLKYTNFHLKSILSVTNRFATGRSYHHPEKSGYMNSRTPNYNSLDMSWVYLAGKRVILYLGLSNILNRENIYGYNFRSNEKDASGYQKSPSTSMSNQSIYIGCFISLGKDAAYNVSNFY